MRRDDYSEYVSARLPRLFRSAYVLCGVRPAVDPVLSEDGGTVAADGFRDDGNEAVVYRC